MSQFDFYFICGVLVAAVFVWLFGGQKQSDIGPLPLPGSANDGEDREAWLRDSDWWKKPK